jgi:hypothetical protein
LPVSGSLYIQYTGLSSSWLITGKIRILPRKLLHIFIVRSGVVYDYQRISKDSSLQVYIGSFNPAVSIVFAFTVAMCLKLLFLSILFISEVHLIFQIFVHNA